jgi:hypothetical protein
MNAMQTACIFFRKHIHGTPKENGCRKIVSNNICCSTTINQQNTINYVMVSGIGMRDIPALWMGSLYVCRRQGYRHGNRKGARGEFDDFGGRACTGTRHKEGRPSILFGWKQ